MKKTLVALLLGVSLHVAASTIDEANQALENNDVVLAKEVYNTLSSKDKNSLNAQVIWGRILLEDEDGEPAYEHFETLIEQYPENVDVNYYFSVSAVIMAQQASVFSKLGYAEDFLKAAEKTIALKPDHVEALQTLVGFHLNAPGIAGGDKEKALNYANQLKNADEIKGAQQLASVYWQTEQKEEALNVIKESLEKHPNNPDLHFYRGIAYVGDEQWSLAMKDLLIAVKYAEDEKAKSQAQYQVGKIAAESGQFIEQGIATIKQATFPDGDSFSQWKAYRLAQLYIHNKEYSLAKQALSQVNYKGDSELKSRVKKLKKKLKKLVS